MILLQVSNFGSFVGQCSFSYSRFTASTDELHRSVYDSLEGTSIPVKCAAAFSTASVTWNDTRSSTRVRGLPQSRVCNVIIRKACSVAVIDMNSQR